MYEPESALFVHCVWATWDRLPLLIGAVERDIYRALGAECVRLGARLIALGGIEDHVHVLFQAPATRAVATMVKQLKGSTAHLINHQPQAEDFFKGQAGYGLVSVSPSHLAQVSNYIAHQREHHANGTLHELLERTGKPPSG